MPINTFNSNLQVVTNVNGDLWDNDEFTAQKAHAEHTRESEPQSERSWATTYVSPAEQEEALQNLYAKETEIEIDPSIEQAHKNDLKIKNIR